MEDQMRQFIKEIKNKSFVALDEATTKQTIILRLFSLIGWNIYDSDEVRPEYSILGKSVDYSLRVYGENKVFVEVKRIGEDLENLSHQEQLLNYSFQEGVELAILTNGLSWYLYLPLNRGSWEQRKFYTIDLIQQDDDEVIKNFMDFLSKENVQTGEAVRLAKEIYKGHQKEAIIRESLPKAWNKLLLDSDERLVGLVSEMVEKLSGYSPTNEHVTNFINKYKNQLVVAEEYEGSGIRRKGVSNRMKTSTRKSSDYAGKRIVAFYFLGQKYEVRYWIEMLIKLSEILLERHGPDFSKVLELRGSRRPYFTRNENELRAPCKIKGTDIYLEANLSANQIVQISNNLVALFGYREKPKVDIRSPHVNKNIQGGTMRNPRKATPERTYISYILDAIIKIGGEGRADDILRIVEKMMAQDKVLTDVDYETLSSGEVRWRNYARWARKKMVDSGLLDPNSSRGVWRITRKGKLATKTRQ